MQKVLQIYRNEQPHLLVNIDEETFFSQVVMGEHIVSSRFISDGPLDIDEGDYVIFGGERFSINKTLPPVTKSAINELSYNLQFQGYIYDLHYCAYRHLGSSEFELFATADVFIGIMVGCLNNIYTGWSVGQIDVTEPKLIQFFENGKGFSCKGAIIKIAEAFGLEFWLTGKTLNLTAQAGVDTNITFEYGRGRGLYEIVRGEIDNELYFNRLYVEGSTRNIPVGYRGGMKRLQIDVPYLQLDIPAGKRIRETSVVIEEIFPKRVGTISAVSADGLNITDTSIDFDLNGQKIEGEKATVEMLTGENSGQSFEIDKYNHTSKTIILVPNTETTGNVRPNAAFEIKPGDQYFFAGIKVPETYIAAAEAELKLKGIELLKKATAYVPPYSVRVSDKFMRDNGLKINAGDRVRLKDAALGIDVKIRVSAVKFSLVDPYTVELLISDVIPYASEDKNIIEIGNAKKETVVVNKVNAEKARRNMLDIRRLQQNVFDPDGYFDGTNIRPNSIETLMLSVGAKSQNFGLNGVSINANTGGDPNFVTVSQGALIHYEIQIEGLGYVWQMSAVEFPALDPAKTYFLSAKCRTTALTGEWVLSETPIKTEEETGYYHFYVGLFYPVTQGSRGYDLTNGMTFIVGDRITTGRIQSLDGLSFLYLSQNKFNVGDLLTGLDWDVTNAGQLTIRGNIVANNASFIGLIVQNLVAGKVRITAAANNIRMVDTARDKIIMLLDDDSALEGSYWSTDKTVDNPDGTPDPNLLGTQIRQENGADVTYYKYAKRGVGATFGTPGEATTAIGRAGIFSTDNNGIIHMQRKLDLTTGRGYIRDNVYNGLIYESLINKTSGLRMSAQFKIQTIGGINYVVADEVQTEVERMYNPNVIADAGDNGNSGGGGGGVILEPTDPTPTNPTTLKAKFPYNVGVAFKDALLNDTQYGGIVKTEFDQMTPENGCKFGKIRPNRATFNFNELNDNFNWAKANGLKVHLHYLLPGGDDKTIQWFLDMESLPNAAVEVEAEIRLHIKTVLQHVMVGTYAGMVVSIDIVNECLTGGGNVKDSMLKRLFGEQYIDIVIDECQKWAPNIPRLLNDFDFEYSTSKVQGVIALRDRIASRGYTLDGIGSQMHSVLRMMTETPTSLNEFRSRIQLIADSGMMLHISELDVRCRRGTDGVSLGPYPFMTPELEAAQANFFVQVHKAPWEIMPQGKLLAVTVWSLDDNSNFENIPTMTDYTSIWYLENGIYKKRLAHQALMNMEIGTELEL